MRKRQSCSYAQILLKSLYEQTKEQNPLVWWEILIKQKPTWVNFGKFWKNFQFLTKNTKRSKIWTSFDSHCAHVHAMHFELLGVSPSLGSSAGNILVYCYVDRIHAKGFSLRGHLSFNNYECSIDFDWFIW